MHNEIIYIILFHDCTIVLGDRVFDFFLDLFSFINWVKCKMINQKYGK